MAVQFALHARKVGKREKIQADRIKEEASMESEVEKARTVLGEEDEEEDEDDYGGTGAKEHDEVEIVDLDDIQDDIEDDIQ